jgi:hypothetical protein
MTPTLKSWAVAAFSHLTPGARRKAVEIAIASAFRMYARLLALGKSDLIYPEVLARYGVVQAKGQMLIAKISSLLMYRGDRQEPDRARRMGSRLRVHSLQGVL